MRSTVVSCCVVIACAACGDDVGASGPVATFAVPESGPIAWGAAPFPSDVYLEGGRVALASMPSRSSMWEAVRGTLGERTGFCGICPIWFPVAGDIDPASVAGHAQLLAPDGAEIPVEAEWHPEADVIAVRPLRGHIMPAGGPYVAVLVRGITSPDGAALRADPGMRSARAQAVVAPALAVAAASGIAEADIAAITAFTVEDPTTFAKDLGARVRAYFATNGAPALTVTRVWRANDGTLDALFGVPAEDTPGLDVPSATGAEGPHGVAHSHVAILIKGTFTSVRAITGTGTDLGMVRDDLVAAEPVPFAIAVPTGADVTTLPVVIAQHGMGGTLSELLALADTITASGAAMIALETFQHGERSIDASDTAHDLRDSTALGPDGFFDSSNATVLGRVIGFTGAPAGQTGNPGLPVGAFTQMVAEQHALLEVIYASDLAPLAAVDASLAGLAFDRSRVGFIGASLGTGIGTALLVGEERIGAAVLNVPAGSFVMSSAEAAGFRPTYETLGGALLDIPNTEYEPAAQLVMTPVVGLYEWMFSRVEPVALVRAMLARPGLDVLWQLADLDEAAGVAAGTHLIAVAGVPGIGEFPHVMVPQGTAPLSGRGAVMFAQADHGMIAYTAGTSTVEPPGLPPFVKRATPLTFANPTAAVNAQVEAFFSSKFATGTAQITAP